MRLQEDIHVLLTAFVILLISFFSASDSLHYKLTATQTTTQDNSLSNFQNKNLVTGGVIDGSGGPELEYQYIENGWNLRLLPFCFEIGSYGSYPMYDCSNWGSEQCRYALKLLGYLTALEIKYYGAISAELQTKIQVLRLHLIDGFRTARCWEQDYDFEPLRDIHKRGLDYIRVLTNPRSHKGPAAWDTPYTGDRIFQPGPCVPNPSPITLPNPNPYMPNLPWWFNNPSSWTLDQMIKFLFIGAAITVTAGAAGYVLTPAMAGCSGGTGALVPTIGLGMKSTPVIVTKGALLQMPTYMGAAAAGGAFINLENFFVEASNEMDIKNPTWTPEQGIEALEPLDEQELQNAISRAVNSPSLGGSAYNKACNHAQQLPICPPLTGGPVLRETGGPTITPTGGSNTCDPIYLNQEVVPTLTPSRGPNVLNVHLDVPEDLAEGLSVLDSDYDSTLGLEGVQVIGGNLPLTSHAYEKFVLSPLLNQLDLDDLCEQNGGGTLYFSLSYKLKPKKGCETLYADYFYSYTCGTGSTTLIETGGPFTPNGQLRPNIPETLKSFVEGHTTITPGGITTPLSYPCSGGVKPPKGSGKTCQDDCKGKTYCDPGNCQCKPKIAKSCGQGITNQKVEYCDPNSKCSKTQCDYNTCTCPIITGKPEDNTRSPVGAATINIPAVSSGITSETWHIYSDGENDPVTVTYTNNLEQHAVSTYQRSPFLVQTTIHVDGTITTYTYQNDLLQTVTHPTFTKQYTYQGGKVDTVTTTLASGEKDTHTYVYSTSYEGYTMVNIFTDEFAISSTSPLTHLHTYLEEDGKPPVQINWPVYTDMIYEHTKKQGIEEVKHIINPQPGTTQGYTTITRTSYTNNQINKQETILDVEGDGNYEKYRLLTYAYDPVGNLIQITTNNGRTYDFTYDIPGGVSPNVLTGITDDEGDSVLAGLRDYSVKV